MKLDKSIIGIILLGFTTHLIRLIRFFPNTDPLMGSMLPLARQRKWWVSVLYVSFFMVLFDMVTGKVGLWTIGTTSIYALIAVSFAFLLKKKKSVTLSTYTGFSVIGVLFFDFMTGPVMSSFLFGMPFVQSLLGQIPFTAMHLLSGVGFTLLFCPLLEPSLTKNSRVWTWVRTNIFSLYNTGM